MFDTLVWLDLTPLWLSILALLGLGIGSFINAAVLRINATESLMGRSQCPHCHHTLAWYTLIPVASYVVLRGACLYCRKPIAIHYPLVEAATAILFVVIGLLYLAQPLTMVVALITVALCVAIFLSDYLFYTIPDAISLPGIVVVVIGQWLSGVAWWQIGLGLAVGAGVFALQYLLSRGRWVGSGDIRFGALIGAAVTWPNIIVALFIAYVSGALVAVPLLMRKRKTMQDALPFGTFLALACIITVLCGDFIVQWYLYDFLRLPA